MMEWMPIETAPKDGTVILVNFKKHGKRNVVHAAFWHQPGNPKKQGYWIIAFGSPLKIATTWQPMPAPPQS